MTGLDATAVLGVETIDLDLDGRQLASKNDLFCRLALLLEGAGRLESASAFVHDVQERESLTSTYMENGVAVPHARSSAVRVPSIAFGRSLEGIRYGDDESAPLARLVFMLAVPATVSSAEYMSMLAMLARLLMHAAFREDLTQARTAQDVLDAVERASARREGNVA